MKPTTIVYQLMNFSETQAFAGLNVRKPFANETQQLLRFNAIDMIFRQTVITRPESFGLKADRRDEMLNWIAEQRRSLNLFKFLQDLEYPDFEKTIQIVIDMERACFEQTCVIYDFEHLKLRIASVNLIKLFPNPDEPIQNCITMENALFRFDKTGKLHAYESTEIIDI